MKKKEPWPGAGIHFEFDSLSDAQNRKILAYVKGMATDKDKLEWIEMFFIEFEYWVGDLKFRANDGPASTLAQWLRALKTRIQRLAAREVARKRAAEQRDQPEFSASAQFGFLALLLSVAEQRDQPEFSAAQCCLAIHYLLHAAGHKERDKAVERLIVALTGWSEDSIRKRLQDMFSRKVQTQKDLQIVKLHFETIGLSKIVELIEGELASRGEDDDF